MDSRQRQDLDNYITGHYGEDQFREERSEFWPQMTAHREYWERHNCAYVYEYDPTADGPEVEVINAFKVAFPFTWNAQVNEAAADIARGMADFIFTTLAAYDLGGYDNR